MNNNDTHGVNFLDEFHNLDNCEANKFLFKWICDHQTQLLQQLRDQELNGSSALKFYSKHPHNPDINDDNTATDGYAYLLTDPGHVQQALQHWSMMPHSYSGEFVLAIDDVDEHRAKRRTLVQKLQDPAIPDYMESALALSAGEFLKAGVKEINRGSKTPTTETVLYDVKHFARSVAIRFVGRYFGISEENLFDPVESEIANTQLSEQRNKKSTLGFLYSASAQAFEEYIWKIHARHFVKKPENMGITVRVVSQLVMHGLQHARADTVFGRFRDDLGAFASSDGNEHSVQKSVVANLVGCIQGLIDNITISACNAIGQMFREANRTDRQPLFTVADLHQCARSSDFDLLRIYYHIAHQIEAPAPFLPRFATHVLKGQYAYKSLDKVQVACATGMGRERFPMLDRNSYIDQRQPNSILLNEAFGSGKDIRMGFGEHDCIGKHLGDELALGIVHKVLSMDALGSASGAVIRSEKKWGWLVEKCQLSIEGKLEKSAPFSPLPSTSSKPSDHHKQTAKPGGSGKSYNTDLVEALLNQDTGRIGVLTNAEISNLPAELFPKLSPNQIAELTVSQIKSLQIDQAAVLDLVHRKSPGGVLSDEQSEYVNKRLSYFGIKRLTSSASARPHRFSLWCGDVAEQEILDYTTWSGLVDLTFTSRHLKPAKQHHVDQLPKDSPYVSKKSYGELTALFKYDKKLARPSRSSLLFPYFAQWFTDSFLGTNPLDRRKNTSTHQIDMCQIYGRSRQVTDILRSNKDGKLRCEEIDGNIFPPRLFDAFGNIKPEFKQLPHVLSGQVRNELARRANAQNRYRNYFASGLAQGNATFGNAALNTLFLREHNQICDELRMQDVSEQWDDERLFQTARMIIILLEIKIVVCEYINHISAPPDTDNTKPKRRVFTLDHEFAEDEPWYRTNHMALEFNLLYRWHCLVPKTVRVGKDSYKLADILSYNDPLVENGLNGVLMSASRQRIDQAGLFSTPSLLLGAEYAALKMSRDYRVQPFNQYRREFGLEPLSSFAELSNCETVVDRLYSLYGGNIDNLDFLIGLYAEKPVEGQLFGSLMTSMVAHDAFTQALTNPLLARKIFTEETITPLGMNILNDTKTLDDIWSRNKDTVKRFDGRESPLSMDFPISG